MGSPKLDSDEQIKAVRHAKDLPEVECEIVFVERAPCRAEISHIIRCGESGAQCVTLGI